MSGSAWDKKFASRQAPASTPRHVRDPRETAPDPSDMWWKAEQKTREEQLRINQERRDWDANLVPVRAKHT